MPTQADQDTSGFFAKLRRIRAAGEHAVVDGNLLDYQFVPTDEGTQPLPLVEALAWDHNAEPEPRAVLCFSIAQGLEQVRMPEVSQRAPVLRGLPRGHDPVEVLPQLTTVLRSHACTLVLDFAEHIAPAHESGPLPREHAFSVETITEWGSDARIRRAGSMIVVLVPQGAVHPLISQRGSGYRALSVPLPDTDARRLMLQRIDEVSRRNPRFAGLDGSTEQLAARSGGLRLVDLQRMSRECAADGQRLGTEAIRTRKREAIRANAGGVLEVHDQGAPSSHVAGMVHVLRYTASLARAAVPPRGMLLVGPPGTGKGLVVSRLGDTLGLPVVSLRNVREQWVGASERNLETALRVLVSMAPVLVWIDEIDQYLGGARNTGQSSDGGTSERLLARLLEFMGDHSAHPDIVWVGTSNRPDILDVAIEDRFPITVPLIHPSAEEIAAMLPAIARQQDLVIDPAADLDDLAHHAAAVRPSARTLVQLMERAAMEAQLAGRGGTITAEDLLTAFGDVRDRVDRVEQEFLALTAIDKTTYRSLFPWAVSPEWTPPDYLEPLLARSATTRMWELDEDALAGRLRELEGIRASRRERR